MHVPVVTVGANLRVARQIAHRSHAVPMLQLFAIALMVIPSDTVIKTIGAIGYPAALVGMFAFGAYVAATLLGLHTPLQHRHPVRSVLCLLWLAALASYVLLDHGTLDGTQVASADRTLMQLAVISGVVLVAAECLTSLNDVRRVLRALVWGGAFCGVIAAFQFWMNLDLTPYLRELPGFSLNFDNPAIIDRGGLNRVSGTAIYPIELGVVAGMLMPLAIYLALWDTDSSTWRRWVPVALIALAIPTSVSRSAIISVATALAVLLVLMPVPQRLFALCALPFAVVGVFMSAPGIIGTLTSFFQAGTSDPSVATRVDDYPLVERLVHESPWFGHGGGTYMPVDVLDVLDNQFLKTAIELGLIGVVALAAYLLVPVVAALIARRQSSDPELRLLCAALAGAGLASAACSLTFDSMAYAMFYGVHALVIGLIGATWRMARGYEATAPIRPRRDFNMRTVLPSGG
jgi:O-Antigen ligase